MQPTDKNKRVCILLLHNRMDSGLYNYALIYKNAYPNSELLLLSDLYLGSSHWKILLLFFFFRKRIVSKIKDELTKFDLVHICDNPIYSLSILKLLARHSIRTIFTVHDPEAHLENTLKKRIKNKLSIFQLKRIYRFVSNSSVIKLHFHYNWSFPFSFQPIVLPHPLYQTKHDITKKQNDILTVGFFGRLEYYKGFDIFLKLISALDSYVAKGEVRVIIAGKGLVDPTFKPQNIDLELHTGFVDDDLFDSLISETDLILMPYRQASQSGVLMKALSFNIPVIVNDLPELKHYIIPHTTGLVLDLNDDTKWLDKLIFYVSNKTDLEKLSANIKKYKMEFEPSKLASEMYA